MSVLQELANPLLEAHSVTGRVEVAVGDCTIAVDSNSEELLRRLRTYFRRFRAEPAAPADIVVTALEAPEPDFGLAFEDWPRDGGKVGRKEAFADVDGGRAVHKVRTGMQFLYGGDLALAVGPCVANDNQIVNFVNAQYIGWLLDRGWVLGHAAGVVTDGRGLAIAGMSGRGKSTFALHLMSHGFAFTSNDRLLVSRDGDRVRMAGVPKLPRVNPGTLLNNEDLQSVLPQDRVAQLESLEEDELWELEEKYDVDVVELFGWSNIEMTAPADALLILNWSRASSAPPRFRPVDLAGRPDLLAAFMKSPGPFYPRRPEDRHSSPAEYLDVLGPVRVFEATGHADFGAGVEAATELLNLRGVTGA